jgi:hypothetical protein
MNSSEEIIATMMEPMLVLNEDQINCQYLLAENTSTKKNSKERLCMK